MKLYVDKKGRLVYSYVGRDGKLCYEEITVLMELNSDGSIIFA